MTRTIAVKPRLLLVDDEPTFLSAMARMLRPFFDVTSFVDPGQAMERLMLINTYDFALCDVAMPGMNGMALYSILQERAPHATARIVFMSGGAFTAEMEAFLASVPHVAKPFRACDVLSACEALMSDASAA